MHRLIIRIPGLAVAGMGCFTIPVLLLTPVAVAAGLFAPSPRSGVLVIAVSLVWILAIIRGIRRRNDGTPRD